MFKIPFRAYFHKQQKHSANDDGATIVSYLDRIVDLLVPFSTSWQSNYQVGLLQ